MPIVEINCAVLVNTSSFSVFKNSFLLTLENIQHIIDTIKEKIPTYGINVSMEQTPPIIASTKLIMLFLLLTGVKVGWSVCFCRLVCRCPRRICAL